MKRLKLLFFLVAGLTSIICAQPISIETKFDDLSQFHCIYSYVEGKPSDFQINVRRIDNEQIEFYFQKKSGEKIFREKVKYSTGSEEEITNYKAVIKFNYTRNYFLFFFKTTKDDNQTNAERFIYINIKDKKVAVLQKKSLNLKQYSVIYFDPIDPVLWIENSEAPHLSKFNIETSAYEGYYEPNGDLIYMDRFILEVSHDKKGKATVNSIDLKTLKPTPISNIPLKKSQGISLGDNLPDGSYRIYTKMEFKDGFGFVWHPEKGIISEFKCNPDTINPLTLMKYSYNWQSANGIKPVGLTGLTTTYIDDKGNICTETDVWSFKIWVDGRGFFIAKRGMSFFASEKFNTEIILTYADGHTETDPRKAEGFDADFLQKHIRPIYIEGLARSLWPVLGSKSKAYDKISADNRIAAGFIDIDKQYSKYGIKELTVLLNKAQELSPAELDKIVFLNPGTGYLSQIIAPVYIKWLSENSETSLAAAGAEKNKIRADFVGKLKLQSPEKEMALKSFELLMKLSSHYYYMGVADLIVLGEKALKTQKYAQAAEIFAHAINKESNNTALHCKLAKANLEDGKVDLALISYNTAIKNNPNWPEAWYGRFKIALRPFEKQGVKANEAMAKEIIGITDTLIKAVDANPSAENKNLLTDALLMRGYFKLFLQNPDLYQELINAQSAKGDDRLTKFEQVQAKVKTLGIQELYTGLHYVIAEEFLKKGVASKDSSLTIKSDERLKLAIDEGLNIPALYYLRYKINWDHLRRAEASMKILEEALNIYPNDSILKMSKVQLHFRNGRVAFKKEDYATAINEINQLLLLDKNPMPVNYQMLAYSYLKQGNLKEGRKYFELTEKQYTNPQILNAFFPNFSEIRGYVKNPGGVMPQMLDRFDEILEYVRRYNDADQLANKKKYSAAKTEYSACTAFFKEVGHTEYELLSIKELGRAYLLNKELKSAQQEFLKALAIDSIDGELYKLLSIAYLNSKDAASSEKILSKGMDLLPENAQIAEGWAGHWAYNGKLANDSKAYTVAADCFKKAIEWAPSNGTYYFSLALVYRGMGKSMNECADLFAKAIELDQSLESVLKDYTQMEREEIRRNQEAMRMEAAASPLEKCACGFVQHTTGGGKCITVVRVNGSNWAINYPCNKNISATDICELATAACLLGDMKSKGFYPW
jgi:tetratricopeptide (TPR) repeat protein